VSDNGRNCLPGRRPLTRLKLRIGGQALYLDVGFYPDGSVGEIWVVMNRVGTALREMVNAWAVEFSNALQRGATLEERVRASLGTRFEPDGEVQGHPVVIRAYSIPDLVARVLAVDYLGWRDIDGLRPEPAPAPARVAGGPGAAPWEASPEELREMSDGYREWAAKTNAPEGA
jgi:ribonucleoside-diphosphate reductase alpha chain